MSPKALLLVSDGSEEMETVIIADILARGTVDVVIAGIEGKQAVKCSRNVIIQPHVALAEVSKDIFDIVILPGGLGGAKAFAASNAVKDILKKHESAGKFVAAICAAPIALNAHGICTGKKLTSYPAMKDQLESSYTYTESRVEVDGNLVTSRGPGTAVEFALKLVELLVGKDKANSLIDPMLLKL